MFAHSCVEGECDTDLEDAGKLQCLSGDRSIECVSMAGVYSN